MKSAGNRSALRLTCSFSRLAGTPKTCARSLSRMTFCPRIVRISNSMFSEGMGAGGLFIWCPSFDPIDFDCAFRLFEFRVAAHQPLHSEPPHLGCYAISQSVFIRVHPWLNFGNAPLIHF